MRKCKKNKQMLEAKRVSGFSCPYRKEDGSCKWPMGCYFNSVTNATYGLQILDERRKKDES